MEGNALKRNLIKIVVLLVALMLVFTGCRQNALKNVVSAYPLTSDQQKLLGYLNLENNATLFSYRCPEEAHTVTASTYVLDNGVWSNTGEGTISWDAGDENSRNGVFTLIYREDRRFDMSLSAQGTSSFRSDPVEVSAELTAFSHAWLTEDQEIQLDKEIPVALFVGDSGNNMESFTTEDYFHPEKFQDLDLVQAVTLTFSA